VIECRTKRVRHFLYYRLLLFFRSAFHRINLCEWCEVEGDETSALVLLCHRVKRIQLLENVRESSLC